MRSGTPHILGTLAMAAACLLSLAPAQAQQTLSLKRGSGPVSGLQITYHVYDLGTFGGSSSTANAINNHGKIVGYADVMFTNFFGTVRRAFQHDGTGPLNAATDNLGTFGGGYSEAFGVNDLGAVVGTAEDPYGDIDVFHHLGPGSLNPTLTFNTSQVYDDYGDCGDGFPPDSPLFEPGYGVAYGINNYDTVVGASTFANGLICFAHYAGQGTLYNRLLYYFGLPGGQSLCYGINNQGTRVGTEQLTSAGLKYHALRVPGGTAGGGMADDYDDIGTMGGDNSAATAINDYGDTVGWSQIKPGSSVSHAFRRLGRDKTGYQYNDYQFGKLNAATDDLGVLAGDYSEAHAINLYGVVVGKSTWSGTGTHAFVFDTKMRDLNNCLDASSTGWNLITANGINNNGWIVGQGIIKGQYHAFVAVPMVPVN